jgi:hypothetical protein
MVNLRKADERRLLIDLNFVSQAGSFDLRALYARAVLLIATHLDQNQEQLGDDLKLRSDEGVIVDLITDQALLNNNMLKSLREGQTFWSCRKSKADMK